MIKLNHKLLIASFISFIILLIWGIIFKLNIYSWIEDNKKYYLEDHNYINNFIPFAEIVNSVKAAGLWHVIYTNVFNVLIFVPFGVYFSYLFNSEKRIIKIAIGSFIVSLLLEIIQWITRLGVFDITDILLNTSGSLLGILLYKYFFAKFNEKAINKFDFFFLMLFSAADIFAIINTIIHFEYYI